MSKPEGETRPRRTTVAAPPTIITIDTTTGAQTRHWFVTSRVPTTRPTNTGIVPNQNASMISAPPQAEPVPRATTAKT
ncbi:MAG: hypothetical protein D6753_05580 [Planctomycetota bacterium]|nr:MAG: hypothetical protein D6753_05580 [Planctomycetota bacterium]